MIHIPFFARVYLLFFVDKKPNPTGSCSLNLSNAKAGDSTRSGFDRLSRRYTEVFADTYSITKIYLICCRSMGCTLAWMVHRFKCQWSWASHVGEHDWWREERAERSNL